MPWIQTTSAQRRRDGIIVVVVLILAALSYIAWPVAARRYDRWSAKQSLRRAREFQAKGDNERAIFSAQRVLEKNPGDAQACRVVAEVLESVGSPQARPWRIRLDAIQPGDPANLIAWAKGAADAGDWASAESVIATVAPAHRESARYHEVVARIAAQKGDPAGAASHWAEAVRIEPAEDRYRLNLAGIQLPSKDADVRAGALAALGALSEKGTQILPARRLLLEDAAKSGDTSRTMALADSLVAAPGATFADKLARLAVLRRFRGLAATRYLDELREAANSNPVELAQLLTWMNANNQAMMVAAWSTSLPSDIATKPPVCVAVAEGLARSLDWSDLRAMTEKGNWMEIDYLRRAYLTRALERLGDDEGGAAQWREALAAVSAGRNAVRHLEQLASVTAAWGWEARTESLYWQMAANEGCPHGVLDTLWKAARERGDTQQLHKVSRLIAKARPKDVPARNYYAFLSLLTGSDEGNPQQTAEALYKGAPDNPGVVSTYALSLCQQGKPAEAVAAMRMLQPEELRTPQTALYYGIALMAAGQVEAAREYLDLGGKRRLLPEEKAWVRKVTAADAEKAGESLALPPGVPEKDPASAHEIR